MAGSSATANKQYYEVYIARVRETMEYLVELLSNALAGARGISVLWFPIVKMCILKDIISLVMGRMFD